MRKYFCAIGDFKNCWPGWWLQTKRNEICTEHTYDYHTHTHTQQNCNSMFMPNMQTLPRRLWLGHKQAPNLRLYTQIPHPLKENTSADSAENSRIITSSSNSSRNRLFRLPGICCGGWQLLRQAHNRFGCRVVSNHVQRSETRIFIDEAHMAS